MYDSDWVHWTFLKSANIFTAGVMRNFCNVSLEKLNICSNGLRAHDESFRTKKYSEIKLFEFDITASKPTQIANTIDLLLGQYTISILGRYSKMALGQYSFLKNSVDIGNWYRPDNNIVIYPISPEYCVNIDLILSCPLKEHWLNTQFLILRSQYWLDTQKYHWANIHFWKIRLILEKYFDPIRVL